MRLLVNPGEKILIPKPSYPLFQFLLEINDVDFDHYPLIYDGKEWRLDCRALERLADEKTKAIILVNPNNPTGSYISRAELDFLNEFCRKHQMAIISDEVFFEYSIYSRRCGQLCRQSAGFDLCIRGAVENAWASADEMCLDLGFRPQEILQESLLVLKSSLILICPSIRRCKMR